MWLRMRSLIALAPDEGAGGGAAGGVASPEPAVGGAAAEPPAAEPGEGQAVGSEAESSKADGAKTGVESAPPEAVKISDKSRSEQARLVGVIKGLQAKLAQRDGEPGAKVEAPAGKADAGAADSKVHPALRGLNVSDDGTVVVDGFEQPASWLIREYERDQRLAKLEQGHQSIQSERERAAFESALDDFGDEVHRAIGEVCESQFAGLAAEHRSDLAEELEERVDGALAAAMRRGEELSPDLAESAITEALSRMRRNAAIFGVEQFEKNRAAGEAEKTRSVGTAGTPPVKNAFTMTKAEAEKHAREAARLANAST